MKEIIIHLIDKTFDNIDGCITALLVFGLVIVLPLIILLNAIK